jgi:hypothetical protein
MNRFSSLIFKFALGVVVIWSVGQVVSDRWLWSQWLLWIPTFAIIFILFLSVIVVTLLHDKQKSCLLGTVLFALTGWFLFVENRAFSSAVSHGDLRIVGWTMSHSKQQLTENSAELIVDLNADVTLLTHGWKVRAEPIIKDWLSNGGKRLISGPFTLFTTLRPIEVRVLVASRGIYISMYKLDTTEQLGKELVIYAVDLPVNLRESRSEIVLRAKRLLGQTGAPTPDLVVGDFNMTRNSNALQRFFPEMTNAWDEVGVGWSYSYHRAFPLFHIDHMLLSDSVYPIKYELIDPQIGRHCIQVLELDAEDFVNHVQITGTCFKRNKWKLRTNANIVFPFH